MGLFGGLFHALALLLGLAGVGKVFRPAGATAALDRLHPPGWNVIGRLPVARILGFAEIGVAITAIVVGSRLSAVVLTLAYLAFTVVAWRLAVGPATDCGCFGATDSPVGGVHVAVDAAFTLAAAATVVVPPGPLGQLPGGPLGGVPQLVLAAVLTGVGYLLFTALPDLTAARRKVEAG